ncbi:MAG TPA: hypothetical protein VK209_01355 [Candidatus Sulfotelmatobacter sp.]|nr:hypothetical protein [Candidatus Sulfotelmatobacter sp.]
MEELVSISKLNGTNPHYTAELRLEKTGNGPDINNAIRVAIFDASNAALGEQAWPPGSNLNIPDGYGGDPADTTNPIPEGLSFEVMATLSFAAVLVGFYSLRKGPKNIWTR